MVCLIPFQSSVSTEVFTTKSPGQKQCSDPMACMHAEEKEIPVVYEEKHVVVEEPKKEEKKPKKEDKKPKMMDKKPKKEKKAPREAVKQCDACHYGPLECKHGLPAVEDHCPKCGRWNTCCSDSDCGDDLKCNMHEEQWGQCTPW